MLKKILFLLLYFIGSHTLQAQLNEISVMSFNIRLDVAVDGENAWPGRVALVGSYMNHVRPDIVGMQEVLHHQLEDILRITPGYAFVGSGRADGMQGGEYSPVFYRTEKFDLLEQGQFWLSETPDVPGSIGWEAILPRVVAWARLRHKATGTELYAFNTHYSHVSDLARSKSMEFMSDKIAEIAADAKVVVTGDFNITKGSELYYDMLARFYRTNRLRNTELVSEELPVNAKSTFNGFKDDSLPRVIDYIFVSEHFEVQSYQVDHFKKDGIFISDHWPVRVSLNLIE